MEHADRCATPTPGPRGSTSFAKTSELRRHRWRRLAAMTEEGLLEKRRYSERPPRDEYVLTDTGRDFLPVLFALAAWGGKHRGGGEFTRFFDEGLGTEIEPVMIDRTTGELIPGRVHPRS